MQAINQTPASHLSAADRINLPNLRWLILAQAAVILPHVTYLPAWLLLVVAIFTGWRWSSFHGYVRLPGAWLRAGLLAGCVGLFLLTYRGRFSVEAAVAFFALAYALKVLEVRAQRDLYLFIFLSFFLLAMKFLFDQSLAVTLYVIAAVWICLVGLARVSNPGGSSRATVRVGKIILQAIPLMLVVYLLFPRIAPLWYVPMQSDQALTGITDRVNPGDIAELAQSGKRAFRVRFEGESPAQQDLYWRGLILDAYQGGEWRDSRASEWFPGRSRTTDLPVTTGYQYEIIQEPTGKPWGFALDTPVKLEGDYSLTPEGLVRFRQDLLQPARYRLGTGSASMEVTLSPLDRQRYTALPPGDNPATRAWISQLQNRYASQEELAQRVMAWFREQPFFYTLKPQRLRGDQVDQFLFDSKRGFCAHFASAFAFAMRAADIPARMVVGYQGGEWNRDAGYLMVHQYDAHAWVELWHEGQGWVRYDPTAMVAPERIEQGIREATAAEGSFLADDPLALSRYHHLGAAQWLRLRMDEMNYNWQRWVVQYDEKTQLDLFKRWYENIDLRTLGSGLLVVMLIAMAVVLALILGGERTREPDPVKRLYQEFEKRLARKGLKREPGETPRQFAARAVAQFPRSAPQIEQLHQRLENLIYAGRSSKAQLTAVRRAIRKLSLKKA